MLRMRRLVIALSLLLIAAATHAASASSPNDRKVLFIGNSLTYVNNLPGAFASLAPAGTHLQVDMIARPGAALEDYEHDAVVAQALSHGGYSDIVLQERGGNATCAPGCEAHLDAFAPTDRATVALARTARAAGARVYYLGTWQRANPQISAGEVRGERRIADLAGLPLIEVSETRRQLVERFPSADWTHADGEHPGHAMTALLALRTWKAVMGTPTDRIPCVPGALWYHAPNPDGVVHIDARAQPITCLVDATMARELSRAP